VTVLVAIALVSLGAVAIAGNILTVVRWWRRRTRASTVPIIGGALAAIGCTLLADWKLAIVPLLVDPGAGWELVALPIVLVRQRAACRQNASSGSTPKPNG
jgi:hypothetical protein